MKAKKNEAIKAINRYIYEKLTSTEAKRSRVWIKVLSKSNGVLKVSWGDPLPKTEKEETKK